MDNSGWDEDVIREDIAQIKENIYYDEMSARYRAEYNRCISELESFYKRELEKSKKCDEITIKYNSLIDIVNNFLRMQDAEKAKE